MMRSLLSLLPLATLVTTLSAQVAPGGPGGAIGPPDVITVTGVANVDCNANLAVDVEPGGDAVGPIGSRRFSARVGRSIHRLDGKADVHGPVVASDSGSSFGNRGYFNSFTEVGGGAAIPRNARVAGSASISFAPVAPFKVEGYFVVHVDGEGFRWNGGTVTATATATAPGGASVTRDQTMPAGGRTDRGTVVRLPATATLSQSVSSSANFARSKARTTVRTSVRFVPTRIWIDPVVIIPGFPPTPEIVVYER